jgi:hypothetical protein
VYASHPVTQSAVICSSSPNRLKWAETTGRSLSPILLLVSGHLFSIYLKSFPGKQWGKRYQLRTSGLLVHHPHGASPSPLLSSLSTYPLHFPPLPLLTPQCCYCTCCPGSMAGPSRARPASLSLREGYAALMSHHQSPGGFFQL